MVKWENLEVPDPRTLEERLNELHRIGEILSAFNEKDLRKLDSSRSTWQSYFMLKAKDTAVRSSCLSRPTGAIIVRQHRIVAAGYNGALPGLQDCMSDGCCYRRACGLKEGKEDKYIQCRSSHAEMNAISFAAKCGVPIDGCDMYVTLYPCSNCSKLIATSGIKKVFYELGYESGNLERDNEWKKQLISSGVEVEKVTLTEFDKLKTIDIIVNITSSRRLKPTG